MYMYVCINDKNVFEIFGPTNLYLHAMLYFFSVLHMSQHVQSEDLRLCLKKEQSFSHGLKRLQALNNYLERTR